MAQAPNDNNGGEWITVNGAHICIGGAGGGKEGDPFIKESSRTAQKTPSPSAKSMLAKQSAKYVGADIQRYSEEHNEPVLAAGVKGVSLRDNEPVDVVVLRKGSVAHGVELKTMVDNKAGKITMKTSAMERKAAWVKEHEAPYHTVVFDDHKAYDANGKGDHDESKRQMFYKRGFGSFRVGSMHPVKDMAELNTLMDTADHDLPAAAKPPKGYIAPANKGQQQANKGQQQANKGQQQANKGQQQANKGQQQANKGQQQARSRVFGLLPAN